MWEPPLLGDFWSCDQRLWQGPSVGKGRADPKGGPGFGWFSGDEKKFALNGLTWFNYITKMWNMYHKWVVSLFKRMNIWKRRFLPTNMFVFSLFDPIWWYGAMVWELSINNGDNDQDVLLNVRSIYKWMAMFVVCCCWIMRFWDALVLDKPEYAWDMEQDRMGWISWSSWGLCLASRHASEPLQQLP